MSKPVSVLRLLFADPGLYVRKMRNEFIVGSVDDFSDYLKG